MIIRLNDNPKIVVASDTFAVVVKPDYNPVTVTGYTSTIVQGSGGTQVFESGVNPKIYTVYTPTGGSATWGNIVGTLAAQTDLQLALDDKLNVSVFSGYTGQTLTTLSELRTDLNTVSGETDTNSQDIIYLSGQTQTKLAIVDFSTYTGVTAPSLYLPITGLSEYWTSGQTMLAISAATSGLTADWNSLLNRPEWLTGATLNDFQNAHTHSQYLTGFTVTAPMVTGITDSLYLHVDALDGYWNSGDTVAYINSRNFLTGVTWGSITGTLSGQTDLQLALDAKLDNSLYQSDILIISGEIDDLITGQTYQLSLITGNTASIATKLDTSIFTGFTGTTLPANYYNKTEVSGLISGFTTGYTFTQSGITVITQVGNDINIYVPADAITGVTWNDVTDKPQWLSGTTLESFQTGHTHSYNDLDDLPTLFSGDYLDLTNKPDLSVYQPVSGMSLYQPVSGMSAYLTGVTFADITGDVSGSTALQAALDLKLDVSVYQSDMLILSGIIDDNYDAFTGYTGTTALLIATKLDTSVFTGFTGTTLPADYYNKTEVDSLISGFTGSYNFFPSGGTEIYDDGNQNVTIYSPVANIYSFFGSGGTQVFEDGQNITIYTAPIEWDDVQNKPDLTLESEFTGHTGNTLIHYQQSAITITESQISDLQAYTLTGTTAALRSDLDTFSGYTMQVYDDEKNPTGFVDGSNVVVTYSYSARTITLTHSSGTIDYYWHGEKHSLVSPWTSDAHTGVTGSYFLYSTDGVNFDWSQVAWQLDYIQVGVVNYQPTEAESFAIRECHELMDYHSHENLHFNIGTYHRSGGAPVIGTYAFDTATDDAVTPSFAQALISDEDLDTIILQLDDTASGYTLMQISGYTNSVYTLDASRPFLAGAGYIYLNNPQTGAMAAGINNRWYNVYQIMIPVAADAPSQKYRMVFLQPQVAHTSLASALAEDTRGLYLGSLTSVSPEMVYYTRITYATSVSNGNYGKVTIPTGGITFITGSKSSTISVTGGVAATNHANLSNLNWDDSGHLGGADYLAAFDAGGAAVAIPKATFTPSGTTAQLQLDLSGVSQTLLNHTGNTAIHFLMQDITGFTTTTDFGSHTGDTAIHYAQSAITITKSQVTDLVTDLATKADKLVTINSITASTYTTTSGDSNEILECQSGCTGVTLHSGATTGFQITFVSLGTQDITFSAQTGSTLRSKGNKVKLGNQYGAATAYKNGTYWYLIGDIE